MVYKCKNCSSSIRYDIVKKKMVCDYCNSEFSVEEIEGSALKGGEEAQTMETKIYVCNACGAELMINDVESATFCAYCGQPTIVFDRISKVRKPDVILPFRITKEEAHARIQEKLSKGFFVPKRIKKIEPEVVRGIFIPFTMSDVRYEDKRLITGRVGSGSNVCNKTFFRHAVANYKGLPVDASVKFNDESAARLAPFPCDALEKFDPAYLSGFYADAGDEQKTDIERKIRDRVAESFEVAVMKTVKASKKETMEETHTCEMLDTKYAMLPVWFFACNDGDFRCTIIVNGYTGKVVGAVPIDKAKVVLLSVLIGIPLVVGLAAALGFIGSLIADSSNDVDTDIFEAIGAGVVALCGAVGAKFKSFKKSVKLAKERDIFDFAKNRQDNR